MADVSAESGPAHASSPQTPNSRRTGNDSPTPCGPSGRYIAELPAFAVQPSKPSGGGGGGGDAARCWIGPFPALAEGAMGRTSSGKGWASTSAYLSPGGAAPPTPASPTPPRSVRPPPDAGTSSEAWPTVARVGHAAQPPFAPLRPLAQSGRSSGPGSWPIEANLQNALQRLLTSLQQDDVRHASAADAASSAARKTLQAGAGGCDESTTSARPAEPATRPAPPSASPQHQQEQHQLRSSSKGAKSKGGKGRSPGGSAAVASSSVAGRPAGAENLNAARSPGHGEGDQGRNKDLNELLRPLQRESPQVVSDFFWSLKKLGVSGVERITQALEESASLHESKRDLEARVDHLELRTQDLEALNRQYQACMHLMDPKQSTEADIADLPDSVSSMSLPPSSPAQSLQGSVQAPPFCMSTCSSARALGSQAVARGWALPPNAEKTDEVVLAPLALSAMTRRHSKSSVTDTLSDISATAGSVSQVAIGTSHMPTVAQKALRGWGPVTPGSTTRSPRTPGPATPSSGLAPRAPSASLVLAGCLEVVGDEDEKGSGAVRDNPRNTPTSSRRMTPTSSSGWSSGAHSRRGAGGSVPSSAAISGAPSPLRSAGIAAEAAEGDGLESKLIHALQSNDALHTENFYLQHFLTLSRSTRRTPHREAHEASGAGDTEGAAGGPASAALFVDAGPAAQDAAAAAASGAAAKVFHICDLDLSPATAAAARTVAAVAAADASPRATGPPAAPPWPKALLARGDATADVAAAPRQEQLRLDEADAQRSRCRTG